jgi:hypothetical protein
MKTIIMVLALLSFPAAADWSFEVGTGMTTYKTAHDGLWYQEQYPHSLDMESVPLSLGVSYGRKDMRFRAEVISLGWVYSSSQVTSDFNYYTGNHIPPGGVMKGRGEATGLLLSVSKDVPIFGLPLYAEAGLWSYKAKWKVSAYTFDRSKEAELGEEPDFRFGPAVGIGIRHGALDVSIRYLDMQHHGETSTQPIYNGAYVLMFKVCL